MTCAKELKRLRDAWDGLTSDPSWQEYVSQFEEVEAWQEHSRDCAKMGLGACVGMKVRIKRETEKLDSLEKKLKEEKDEFRDAFNSAGICMTKHYIVPLL